MGVLGQHRSQHRERGSRADGEGLAAAHRPSLRGGEPCAGRAGTVAGARPGSCPATGKPLRGRESPARRVGGAPRCSVTSASPAARLRRRPGLLRVLPLRAPVIGTQEPVRGAASQTPPQVQESDVAF